MLQINVALLNFVVINDFWNFTDPKLLNVHIVCWFSRENCTRGWRLFSLVTGFFPCSNTLLPYCTRHLEAIFQDANHPFQGTLFTCGCCCTIWLESYLHLLVLRIAVFVFALGYVNIIFVYRTGKCVLEESQTITPFRRTQTHPFTFRDGGHFGKWRHVRKEKMLNRADESMCNCFLCSAGWEELPSAAHKAAWWNRIYLQDSQL